MKKTIKYNRTTRDYDLFADDRYIGSRATIRAAERDLDEYVYDAILHGDCATATELDGATCPECDGDGRFPSDGCGDCAGGWAETCEACRGTGRVAGVAA